MAGGGCHRCWRRFEKKVARCCKRLRDGCLNPDFWYSTATMPLSRWVRQRVVVAWSIVETTIAMVLMIPFLVAPQVSRMGTVINSFQPMIGILLIRAFSGLGGTFASCGRKVGRTKVYFGTMVANILLSVLLAEPLINCRCSCEDVKNIQCGIVMKFFVWVDLMKVADPRAAFRFRRLASDGPSLGQRWGHFSDLVHLVQPQPSAAAAARGAGRMAQDTTRRAVTQLDSGYPPDLDPDEHNHRPGDLLDLDRAMELLDRYNVTDVGIKWQWNALINCTSLTGMGPISSADLREPLLLLQCGDKAKIAEPMQFRKLGPFQEYLEFCEREHGCEVVTLQVDVGGVVGEQLVEPAYSVCRYSGPVVPLLSVLDAGGDQCLCSDRCVPEMLVKTEHCDSCNSMLSYLVLRDHSKKAYTPLGPQDTKTQIAEFFCRMTVSFTLGLVCLLDVMAVLMTFVVYAFMKNRCGDVFVEEDQFDVSRDSRFRDSTATTYMDDDEDDFVAVDLGPTMSQTPTMRSVVTRRDEGSQPELEMSAM